MNHWCFTITHTKAGYDWTVHHGNRLHAHGIAAEYETAWLDSHDTIPDVTILVERRIPATPQASARRGPALPR